MEANNCFKIPHKFNSLQLPNTVNPRISTRGAYLKFRSGMGGGHLFEGDAYSKGDAYLIFRNRARWSFIFEQQM